MSRDTKNNRYPHPQSSVRKPAETLGPGSRFPEGISAPPSEAMRMGAEAPRQEPSPWPQGRRSGSPRRSGCPGCLRSGAALHGDPAVGRGHVEGCPSGRDMSAGGEGGAGSSDGEGRMLAVDGDGEGLPSCARATYGRSLRRRFPSGWGSPKSVWGATPRCRRPSLPGTRRTSPEKNRKGPIVGKSSENNHCVLLVVLKQASPDKLIHHLPRSLLNWLWQ